MMSLKEKLSIKKIPYNQIYERLLQVLSHGWNILTISPHETSLIPRSCCTLSIDKNFVSVVYVVSSFFRYTVKRSKTYTFSEEAFPEPQDVISILTLFLEENKLKPKNITLSIPKSWVVVKKWDLPRVVEHDLSLAITNEIDIITPFSAEEVFFDHIILDMDDEKIYFLVTATKIDKVKSYINILEENDFHIDRLTFNFSGLATLCTFLNKNKVNTFVLCTEGKTDFKVGAVIDGYLSFAYSLDLHDDEIENAIEIENILKTVLSLSEKETPEIIAAFDRENSLLKYVLEEKFGNIVTTMETLDTSPLSLEDKNTELLGAVGAGLESILSGPGNLNLFHCGKHEKSKKSYALTMILSGLVFVLIAFNLYIPIHVGQMDIEHLSSRIEALEKDVRKVKKIKKDSETLKSEIMAINHFGKGAYIPLEILKALTFLIPENSWITRLRIKSDGIEIDGYSNSATALIVKLEESKFFRKVEFSSPTVKDRRMKMDRFRIKAEIEEEGEKSDER